MSFMGATSNSDSLRSGWKVSSTLKPSLKNSPLFAAPTSPPTSLPSNLPLQLLLLNETSHVLQQIINEDSRDGQENQGLGHESQLQ
ncbi:hypothetical protein Ocin01_20159, partial [Orchesella cincta]